MKRFVTLIMAVMILLMAIPVMALACTSHDDTVSAPLEAVADFVSFVYVTLGSSDLIAAGAALRGVTLERTFMDMDTLAGGMGHDIASSRAMDDSLYGYLGTGPSIIPRARERPVV